MQKIYLAILIALLFNSCTPQIKVDEICLVQSMIDGEFITKTEFLSLVKNNDPTGFEIDTVYFKIDKKSKNKFKLTNQEEYSSLVGNEKYELEKYIHLKSSNQTEQALNQTLIEYRIPKFTDRKKGICREDLTPEIWRVIKEQLSSNGYPIKSVNNSKFEGEFKEVFIQYQKDHQLPFGRIDLETLNSLGIKVIEK